jgi:hypothetical protein
MATEKFDPLAVMARIKGQYTTSPQGVTTLGDYSWAAPGYRPPTPARSVTTPMAPSGGGGGGGGAPTGDQGAFAKAFMAEHKQRMSQQARQMRDAGKPYRDPSYTPPYGSGRDYDDSEAGSAAGIVGGEPVGGSVGEAGQGAGDLFG